VIALEILSGFAGIVTALSIARLILLGWQHAVAWLYRAAEAGCEAARDEIIRTLALP